MSWVRQALDEYGLRLLVLCAVLVAMAIYSPGFNGEVAIFVSLERLMLLGVVAAGLALTMIAGELDLSVGSVAVLAGVVAIDLADLGLWPCVLIATAIAALLGALQGMLIAKLGVNSLVLTIGALILWRGVAWVLAGGAPISLKDFSISDAMLLRWGVFSLGSLIAIAVIALVGIFLAVTKWGREIYAIGGARSEAIAAGVPTTRPLILAFTISAACAGLAGALSSVKSASVTPDSFGTLLLLAVAACLIGGIDVRGGRGDVLHIVLGVLILSALSAGLASGGAQAYYVEFVTGALLLIVVALDFVLKGLRRRRLLALTATS
ncbi:ABC transporter permease [Paenarthrobacter nicotinovorans]|uniref:ABC transporter permease n=1 Tax=Paenarthrobacter nicotinovorans TaxID=29320 RepID=UPI00382AF1FB